MGTHQLQIILRIITAVLENYTVVLTATSYNSCIDRDTQVVSSYPNPTITLNTTDITCNAMNDGHVVVHASSGTSPYLFRLNSGGAQPDSNFFNLQKGNFQVVVTDNHGCSSTASGSIAEPDMIKLALTATDLNCKGDNSGIIQVNASGGTGTLSYSKDGGLNFQSSNTFNNLAAGY
jgi:hypothetical protein